MAAAFTACGSDDDSPSGSGVTPYPLPPSVGENFLAGKTLTQTSTSGITSTLTFRSNDFTYSETGSGEQTAQKNYRYTYDANTNTLSAQRTDRDLSRVPDDLVRRKYTEDLKRIETLSVSRNDTNMVTLASKFTGNMQSTYCSFSSTSGISIDNGYEISIRSASASIYFIFEWGGDGTNGDFTANVYSEDEEENVSGLGQAKGTYSVSLNSANPLALDVTFTEMPNLPSGITGPAREKYTFNVNSSGGDQNLPTGEFTIN